MRTLNSIAAAAVMLLITGSAAMAGQAYHYTIPSPGWFDGDGTTPNGEFTHNDNGDVSIDLRAKNRQDPTLITPVGDVYQVAAGPSPFNSARDIWNYEFNIGCISCGGPSLDMTMLDLLNASTITISDLTKGTSGTTSMSHWTDDSVSSLGGKYTGIFFPFTISAENSENMTFPDNPLAGYDMNDQDYYRFTINLNDPRTNALLVTDTMDVRVGNAPDPTTQVPEPISASLFGAGLAGLALVRRRKKTAGTGQIA